MSKSNAVPPLSETVSTAAAAADDDHQVYIPRTKRPRKEDLFIDKASLEHQTVAWHAFKETIDDLVKQIHTSNVTIIIRQLLQNNIIRFRDECGKKLLQLDQHELDVQFKKLNDLLGESLITECIKNMIEKIFFERTNELKSYPAIQSNLKLVNENNQFKHMLQLDDYFESESWIDIFKFDEQYEVNEKQYHEIRKGIFEYFDFGFESSSNSSDSDEEDDDTETKQQRVTDPSDTDSITVRRKTCLTLQSNISAKECAKKLLKMNLYREQDLDVCEIIVDICGQQPTYERFFGLVGQHICLLDKDCIFSFGQIFGNWHKNADRLTEVKSRNVTKLFAYLLATNSIHWRVFECIHLVENNLRSSSCDYLKSLFIELYKCIGFTKMKNNLTDPKLSNYFQGLFPSDNPENAQFRINFFTSIGLGRIINELSKFIISNPTPASSSLMSIYDINFGKLCQAGILLHEKDILLQDLETDEQTKNGEALYLQNTLKETQDNLNQEKRLNSAIKLGRARFHSRFLTFFHNVDQSQSNELIRCSGGSTTTLHHHCSPEEATSKIQTVKRDMN
ncbi:unnamed protein product [Rotaria magnacalcarata]|uniref:MI domain-containing protein n=2 Tax=Rotaria magnacalcarata TaxID=392030 RepID=A0A814G8H6_9BILA|nr:unnamed protein product [Rotaria magnacalcarata]